MKKFSFLLAVLFLYHVSFSQDATQMHETAKAFIKQGDYSNAILVLNRALLLKPGDLEIAKDLGLSYYFAKDYNKALDVYKPLVERDDADDQVFQVAGDIYQALEQFKDCDRIYKKGLKKFPNSGALYNEWGKMLWIQKDFGAIKQWEKGIEMDPGFSKNYYNACIYYYFSTDRVWSLLYGEIFLNIEPLSMYSQEVKNVLLEGYKKLFADADLEKANTEKNGFTAAFMKTMNRQTAAVTSGITAESLTMLRTRFILDWYASYSTKYPFKLFELQHQLLQDGMFDAYNQWIFAAAQNLPAYQNWTITHADEYNELNRFQKGRIFKVPAGQYYR